jgi:hypothetical protein
MLIAGMARYAVVSRHSKRVRRHATAGPDHRTSGAGEGIARLVAHDRRKRLHFHRRQLEILALSHVEDGVVPKERDGPLADIEFPLIVSASNREGLPEDDERATLAATDLASEIPGLLVRDPARVREAAGVHGESEEHHVDPGVQVSGDRVPHAPHCAKRAPRTNPGRDAALFLYLDPFTAEGLEWATLARVAELVNREYQIHYLGLSSGTFEMRTRVSGYTGPPPSRL